jgi:hypothetical protein
MPCLIFVDEVRKLALRGSTRTYCVQPCTVKQWCVLNECISNNDNFSWICIGFLYALIRRGKRANHYRDRRERVIWHSASVQSSEISFKEIEREFYRMCCSGWQHLMRRTHDKSFTRKDIARLTTFGVDQDWTTWSKDHITQMFYFLITIWMCYISHERHLDWRQVAYFVQSGYHYIGNIWLRQNACLQPTL